MFCRCAGVSVTLFGVTAGVCLLSFESFEQPASDINAVAINIVAARFKSELFSIVVLRQFRAVPPAAAERLEQRRRVGVSICLREHEIDPGLLTRLFGTQQRKIASHARMPLAFRQVERNLRS